jgi:hypothetical protein
MQRYEQRVDDVGKVINTMISAGLISNRNDIENDHIAFRTLGVPNLGLASLEKIFLHCGYERREPYHFASKKLDAFWYSPPTPEMPRVFISELRVGDLSAQSQAIIASYTASITADPVDQLDLNSAEEVDQFLHSPLWKLPSWHDYKSLLTESEYAAWVIYNRYYLNHFTISVHNLSPPYNSIETFNQLLKTNGVQLNNAGGEIKTSPDGLLLQSSSVAQIVESEFTNDTGGTETHPIAGSYVEFAQRNILPEFADLPASKIGRHHRRDGFEAGNADKIFESTFSEQTKRRNES